MDRQEMLDKIYDVIADKSETEWCICEVQLPIELSTNITNNSHGIEWFVQWVFYEWVYMYYIKRLRLNWWLNIIDFDVSELPLVFDKYKKYILREKEKFFIKKAPDTERSIGHHRGYEYLYDRRWDFKNRENYFSKYNPNSKKSYSVTHQDRIQDRTWKIDLDINYNISSIKIIWHPVMIGDVLDWAEKTICSRRSRKCPLCWWEIYEDEDEIWDFWRIYQKWYYACEDKKWCGFFTNYSSSELNNHYECNWDALNICRDFIVPEYFGRKISDKIYADNADAAYGCTQDSINTYWGDKRKPIDNQPIECIEYIYNLL